MPTAMGGYSPPRLQVLRQRRYLWVRLRSVGVVTLYTALLVVLALYAYWQIFNWWAGYDDEGFFVYSLKTFVDGHHLYSGTYSEYGPFYYAVFGLFFKITGIAVTEDAGRFITIFCWLASSFGLGLTAHRFTKSAWIGLATTIASYSLLRTFQTGDMHAEILVSLVTSLLGATFLLALPRFRRAGPFLVGGLTAGLLLTKINLGGYACLAVAFALVLVGPRLLRRHWLCAIATAVFAVVGVVLMRSEWSASVERAYAICYGLSAVALAVACWPNRSDREADAGMGQVWWVVIGFLACACLTLAAVLALGMSPSAWIQETIVTPSHQGKFLSNYLYIRDYQLIAGVGGLVVALLSRLALARRPAAIGVIVERVPQWIPSVARLLVGLLILGAAAPVFFFKKQYAPYEAAWALVWIIALPPGPVRREERLGRVMLAALAISQSLEAYPVPGSQVAIGDLLFVLCGAVALGDGVEGLRRWGPSVPRSLGRAVVGLGLAVVAALAIWSYQSTIGSGLTTAETIYNTDNAPIKGIGAGRMRIGHPWVDDINAAVAKVHGEHCRYLMEIPGMYSFNLWTGLNTPSPLTGQQPYWESLTATQQLAVLGAARSASNLCLIKDQSNIDFYIGTEPIPKVPLMNYLTNAFKTVAVYGDFVVMVRKA